MTAFVRAPGSKTPGVLFVGHDASRTGAPLLLLHFLRWLAAHSPMPFEVLLSNGGVLEPEYAAVTRTHVLHRASTRLGRCWRRFRQLLRVLPPLERRLAHRYPIEAFPLVYANTVANGEIVAAFGRQGYRVICHAHEMRVAIERWGGRAGEQSSQFIHEFIAASQPVKRALADQWGVAAAKVEVIPEFGQPLVLDAQKQAATRTQIRRKLACGDSELLVGLCGTLEWRKGSDLLPQLAKAVAGHPGGSAFRFVWIGSSPSALEKFQLEHDLMILGLSERVLLPGSVANSQEYMMACDIFALTSREDPCPLVMLEAATLALPIVCFADSGGAPEFVGSDAGQVVPYLDIEAMARALLALAASPETRRTLGRNAQTRALASYSLETQAPKLLAVIQRNRG